MYIVYDNYYVDFYSQEKEHCKYWHELCKKLLIYEWQKKVVKMYSANNELVNF